jgi:cyanate permease
VSVRNALNVWCYAFSGNTAASIVETGSSSFAVFSFVLRTAIASPVWRGGTDCFYKRYGSKNPDIISETKHLGMRLGDAAALRVVGVVAFLLAAVPSAWLATRLGRRQTVTLGLLLVMFTYGATAAWVATPEAYALVLGVGGIGGALVLVNILPLVFDLGADTQYGTCTGLVAVPVQAAAVLGASVAGVLVEATGTQRTLFGVAAVAVGLAWLLLQRVHIEPATR